MDDPKTTITSQFGHSSQELINLLLTGQAVSNVFDNSITISAEYKCRGIQRRPAIGYLSQLESLRHCEVGGYYKSPLLPIWIIGSTSHFSVLFGDERCLKESSSDLLLEQCRRAFKKVEGGGDGFILAGNLGQVVDELDLRGKLGGDNGVHTLQAVLEVQGAGIILWDDFWKKASRLMTGSSLEHVLNDNSIDGGPPLLITQFGEKSASGPTAPSTMESDEELAKKLAAEWGTDNAVVDQGTKSDEDYARELQAQWDAERFGNSSSTGDNLLDLASQVAHVDDAESLSSSRPPSPVADYAVENGLGPAIFGDGYYNPTKFQPIADSTGENGFTPPNFGDGYYDPTKTLQPIADSTVENDSAPFGFNDVNALCKTELASARKTVQFAAQSKPQNFDFEDVKRKAERERFEVVSAMCKEAEEARFAAQSKPQNFDFEKLGVSFPLYHYNGLRGGCLTPFRVTRLSPEEAVGASIALSSKGAGSGRDGGDLEDVVRTKWPSCMFNWLGKDPPYIG